MSAAPPDRTVLQVEITVEVPVEHAFEVFTERFDEIKPREHNLLAVPIERTVLEPRVGGTIRDIGVDGSTCVWARVLAYEPPRRLVISWDINPRWQIEPDFSRTSEVEIRFLADTPDRPGSCWSTDIWTDTARDGKPSPPSTLTRAGSCTCSATKPS